MPSQRYSLNHPRAPPTADAPVAFGCWLRVLVRCRLEWESLRRRLNGSLSVKPLLIRTDGGAGPWGLAADSERLCWACPPHARLGVSAVAVGSRRPGEETRGRTNVLAAAGWVSRSSTMIWQVVATDRPTSDSHRVREAR
jgi:hypothetical protein